MLPRLSSPRQIYTNPYWSIDVVEADFGEFQREYFVSRDGVRAGVLVVEKDRVLLVRQYRLLLHGFSYELPGGGVDEGETPAEAAARECAEETGIRPENLQPVIDYQLALDSRDNPTHLFFADTHSVVASPAKLEHEGVGVEWLPLRQCLDMVFDGTICDSFSVIGLLAFNQRFRRQSGSS